MINLFATYHENLSKEADSLIIFLNNCFNLDQGYSQYRVLIELQKFWEICDDM